MLPIEADVLRQLKISEALVRIAATERNLVPSEPGWDQLTKDNKTITTISRYIESRCRSGVDLATERELLARKPGHGVRPIALWGLQEQVLYEALTEAALRGFPKLDRSVESYIKFVGAPAAYARELQGGNPPAPGRFLLSVLGSEVKYVVKSDITAFYQYIDHAILADELIAQGADYGIVAHLVELLSEVTGRPAGLPQLYHASDRLSEVYADQVERNLLRQGFAVWRFNDDFRIACRSFSDSIAAIEALDSAARSVGLAINELKTFTFHFSTYVMNTYGLDKLDEDGTISVDDVEAAAGDYTDNFNEKPESALKLVSTANISGRSGIDLRTADHDDIRRLRRALHALTRAQNASAFEYIALLIGFLPSLTPDLMKYLTEVGKGENKERAGNTLDGVVEKSSLNMWQRVWLIESYRSLNLLSGESAIIDSRLAWIRECFYAGKEPLRAVAFRALAASSQVSVVDAVGEAANAPEAVRALYFASVRDRLPVNPTADEGKSIAALRNTDPIAKALLA